jgi:hypothetical protein
MRVVSIGKTSEGRDQLMSIVTSPSNMRWLDYYRDVSRRLCLADGLLDEEAQDLAKRGKAVVWIDGGLHATEVLGAQQLMETLYRLVSREDPETLRILDDCIVLFVHANPDGMDLVSDWYMRNPDPLKRSLDNLPRLYQKYIGHDNNRDFYASTQRETENMNRVMYREWFPQIMYNHHQTGPRGTVMFAPPFRPPFNHHTDPLVMSGVEVVGSAMHNRFILENKPGVTMRTGAGYSAWWNGGLRTTAYFHNMIGILTETIGSPTPMRIPFVPERQVMNGDLLFPIEPQEWKFAQSIEYSVTANMAILDLASRRREHFLYGIYRMGKNSVERGRRDTWTNYPSRVDKAVAAAGRDSAKAAELLRAPELRDARAYVIPVDQPDFPTAVKFANALIETGVKVHQATADFAIGGKRYAKGSLVVRADQAFRPHVLDMFEPQDHPNDIPAPGAPPTPPYDNAGYTLAYQMGVKFDRVLDPFEGPLAPSAPELQPLPGQLSGPARFGGYLLSPQQNDAFAVVQRVIDAGEKVFRVTQSLGGKSIPVGDFWIPRSEKSQAIVEHAVTQSGIDARRVERLHPMYAPQPVRPLRVGLWDRYGGSMPSGWIRWILEQWGVPHRLVFAPDIDRGDLRSKVDVLILPDGAIPAPGSTSTPTRETPMPADLPTEFRGHWGRLTAEKSFPELRRFMEGGGKILAIGTSTGLAAALGLPIESALTGPDGKPLPRAQYYIPGSVLQARVDPSLPVAWGMPERADFMFDESPAFRLKTGAESMGVRRIAWFDSEQPLRSGWAWGQKYLKDAVAAAQVPVGQGTLYLFGPEITFRAQPHGTFRLLFNGIFAADSAPAPR